MSPAIYTTIMAGLLVIPLVISSWYILRKLSLRRKKDKARNFILHYLNGAEIERGQLLEVLRQHKLGLSLEQIRQLLHELRETGIITAKEERYENRRTWTIYSLPSMNQPTSPAIKA